VLLAAACTAAFPTAQPIGTLAIRHHDRVAGGRVKIRQRSRPCRRSARPRSGSAPDRAGDRHARDPAAFTTVQAIGTLAIRQHR
jgi:hypothetical protein